VFSFNLVQVFAVHVFCYHHEDFFRIYIVYVLKVKKPLWKTEEMHSKTFSEHVFCQLLFVCLTSNKFLCMFYILIEL